MTDEEYIRKAAELVGWGYTRPMHSADTPYLFIPSGPTIGKRTDQHTLDALAAELVRQVDALETHRVESHAASVMVYETHYPVNHAIAVRHGPDRPMNAIKAIVDSKVLECKSTSTTT